MKEVETYFARKEINRRARFGNKRSLAEWPNDSLADAPQTSQTPKSKRPSLSQLDPVTGSIRWTRALLDVEFDAERRELNRFFADRAKQMGEASEWDVQDVTRRVLAKLKTKVRDMETKEYMACTKLIRQLAEEAKYLQVPATLATK